MKVFTVPCIFWGTKESPCDIFIGNDFHPDFPLLHFQSHYLREQGGVIPHGFIEWIDKIQRIAAEHGCDFEELCVYANRRKISKSKSTIIWNKVLPKINEEKRNEFISILVKDILTYEKDSEKKLRMHAG